VVRLELRATVRAGFRIGERPWLGCGKNIAAGTTSARPLFWDKRRAVSTGARCRGLGVERARVSMIHRGQNLIGGGRKWDQDGKENRASG